MVGDHGQIIPFRRVKGIAIALITVASLAILAAVGLGLWGGWLRVQNAGLQSELTTSREAVRKLRDEKDLLMARVVILETRQQKPGATAAGAKPKPAPPPPQKADPAAGEAPTAKQSAPAAAPAATANPQSADASAKDAEAASAPQKQAAKATSATAAPVPDAAVAVTAFIADHSPRQNTLSASFQIRNTGPRGRKVGGRCVLVLKNRVGDKEWVSVPHVSLISGRPNGKQGRAFRIANFMTLKMQTREVPDNFAFDTGTLHVYDDGGRQILEKEVPVQLTYRKPAPEPPPAPETPPAPTPEAQPAPATGTTADTVSSAPAEDGATVSSPPAGETGSALIPAPTATSAGSAAPTPAPERPAEAPTDTAPPPLPDQTRGVAVDPGPQSGAGQPPPAAGTPPAAPGTPPETEDTR